MPLQKQAVSVNFAQGLDTFTDPFQIPSGKFAALSNAVFLKEATSSYALLSKRNGFGSLTTLPDATSKYLTTYSNNLMAIGSDIKSYSDATTLWTSKGLYRPLQLSVQSMVQNGYNQQFVDSATINGLVCLSYLEVAAQTAIIGGTVASVSYVSVAKYVVSNLSTGEQVVPPTIINPTFGSVSFSPRVYAFNNKFTLLFDGTVGSNSHLQYMWIDATNPSTVSSVSEISSDHTPGFPQAFDAVVASNSLYVSWSARTSSSVFTGFLSSAFAFTGPRTLSSQSATSASLKMSVDNSSGSAVIWTSFMGPIIKLQPAGVESHHLNMVAMSPNFSLVMPPVDLGMINNFGILSSLSFFYSSNMVCRAADGVNTAYVEIGNRRPVWTWIRGYIAETNDPKNPTPGINLPGPFLYNQISIINVPKTAASGSFALGTSATLPNGLGLASSPITVNSVSYLLTEYQSQYQSTYFLVDSTGFIAAKLSYGNGFNDNGDGTLSLTNIGTSGNYLPYGVPTALSIGSNSIAIPYLFKDSITSVAKATNVSSTTPTAGIFSQTGIGLSRFDINTSAINTVEAGKNLNLNGGYLWQYDGNLPSEYGTHVFPDFAIATTGSGSNLLGSMSVQSYFYQAIYEWIDNKGNLLYSAPSIPYNVNVASGFSSCVVTVPVLTVASNIKATNTKISLFRWSTGQQSYYLVDSQIASGSSPYYLGTGVTGASTVAFLDKFSDAAILGNQLLYTTGGVVENQSPPATSSMTIFDTRVWLINSEDPNLLWYSKPIVENSPVEMSDLLTYFVPPTASGIGTTGPMRTLAAMDDKLIVFKNNSIFYINGTGPDSTGANNQYSSPILITNGVGCTNQNSIVLIPNGLMFQSSKGIWLLKRDLSVDFIGKDVEAHNAATVLSVNLIPDTNQVRFTLSSGLMLMYDYYVNQWGTFNVSGLSSTIFNGLHTYLDSSGNVFRETLNSYSDGSTGVVMSFTTGWISMAGLQGYKRLYRMFMLGSYKSPHALNGTIAYDFGAVTQSFQINPTNTTGSGSQLEQWQINFNTQQCQSFQLSMTEVPSVSSGAGLTISGLRIIAGVKAEAPKNIGISNKIS